MSKMKLLMGASALVAATAALSGGANAAVSTYIYGAGSSLAAPYLRQAFDCYGNPTQLVNQGSTLTSPTYASPPVAYFNFTAAPKQNCNPTASQEVNTSIQGDYLSTGSGTGLKGFLSHSAANYWGDFIPGTSPSPYPAVTLAASETAFGAADVTVYNSGGVDPTTGQTLGPAPAPYPTPAPLYGPMIQIPELITPVTLAYSAEYGRYMASDGTIHHYHFNVKSPRSDGSGGLVLDAATYCAIFNGQYTDWNQIPTSLNGGQSLQDPQDLADGHSFSVPLVLVGRADGSGTTSVFTRHLAAQCTGAVYSGTQNYLDSTSNLPTTNNLSSASTRYWNKTQVNYGSGSLSSTMTGDVAGVFTMAKGSDGVADYVEFNPNNLPTAIGQVVEQGRLGYVGPDYVLPSVTNTGNNTFGLNTASLLRPGGSAPISPTAAASLSAYNGIVPPTGANLSHPDLWVQAASKTAQIAIPKLATAYPIVGTSNIVTYTCFNETARPGTTAALKAFESWYWTGKTVNTAKLGILAKAGLAAMPANWATAINTEFFNPNVTTTPHHLYIAAAGDSTATQCASVSPGA